MEDLFKGIAIAAIGVVIILYLQQIRSSRHAEKLVLWFKANPTHYNDRADIIESINDQWRQGWAKTRYADVIKGFNRYFNRNNNREICPGCGGSLALIYHSGQPVNGGAWFYIICQKCQIIVGEKELPIV